MALSRKQLAKIREGILERLDVVDLLEELDLDGIRERTDEVNALCPFHDDSKQSFAINRESGAFHCMACHAKGSAFDLYGRMKLLGYVDCLNDLAKFVGMRAVDKRRPIKESAVKRWHKYLIDHDETMEYLEEERGITKDVVEEFELGFDGDRICIPIRDAQGRLRNVRKYLPNAGSKPKIVSHRNGDQTYGENRLFNIQALTESEVDDVWICEGEMDCLLLLSEGFNAVTPTTGAGAIHPDWRHWFEGKTVYLVPDRDEAGLLGAAKIARLLAHFATIKIVHLPNDVGEGGDVTDFFMEREYDADTLEELGANAKIHEEADPIDLTPEEKKDAKDAVEVNLWDATKAEYQGDPLKTTAMVSAKGQETFQCPRKIRYVCDETTGKVCNDCQIFNIWGGRREVTIKADDPNILRLINTSIAQQRAAIREIGGCGQNCRTVQIEVLEHMDVEEVFLIPHIDIFARMGENHEYVNRRAYILGHGIQGQRVYDTVGYTHPDPKTQGAVLVFQEASEAEDSIDKFKLTDKDKKRLQRFKPKEWTEVAIQKTLDRIYKDFSENVHGLQERSDMQILMDLVWHAPLSFVWMGKEERKGYIEGLIIGDTGQAKTEMSTLLRKHYQLGDRIQGEQTSNAGLVGGVEKFGERWVVTWGKIPLNDRRLLVIDEFSGISAEQISKMSDLRSTGVAEISKIRGDKTSARARLLLLSNTRQGRPISTYNSPIDSVMELFDRSEDVRRTDIALAVTSEQVDPDAYKDARVSGSKPYFDSERCRDLILWSWSRKANQIQFTKRAERLIVEEATKMGKKYSSKAPLVNASDQRLKLAKLAASLAARTFSTDTTGNKLVVRECHVQWIVSYVNRIYDDTLGYGEFSQRIHKEEEFSPGELKKLKEEFRDHPSARRLADRLMRLRLFQPRNLAEQVGLEQEEMSRILVWMMDYHLLKPLQRDYTKSAKFIHLLQVLLAENVWYDSDQKVQIKWKKKRSKK